MLYYGARYYDADIGRFTTADTIKGDISAPQTLNRYVYTLNNPLKYVDPTGNEFRYSAYTSPQFTPFPYSTFSYGIGGRINPLNIEKIKLYPEINFDFIASGDDPVTQLIHPIYGALNLNVNWKPLENIGVGWEHTSAHALSLGANPSVQLKDFPSIKEYGGGENRFFVDNDAGFLLREDFFKSNSYEETRYFGETNLFSLAYSPSSNLELSAGIASADSYSTLSSVLGLNGPPILVGEDSYRGLFGRAILNSNAGTFSLAGIGDSKPFFALGFQKQFEINEKDKLSFFAQCGSSGNYGCGVTLQTSLYDRK